MVNAESRGTGARGFASMNPERQKEIASLGGRAAHAQGTAHEFTSDEARAAGRKGGETVSRNRAHMAEIGRRGGESRGSSARNGGRNGNGASSSEPTAQMMEPVNNVGVWQAAAPQTEGG